MSKEQVGRQPKCSRCRNHGVIALQKGHVKVCPFRKCGCCKCRLVSERSRITNLQRNLKKAKNTDKKHPRPRTGVSAEKPANPVPDRGAPQSATSGAPKSDGTDDGIPLDLRRRPAEGGESAAGVKGEGGPSSSSNAPYFDAFNQRAPLPFIHVPFRTPDQPVELGYSLMLYPSFLLTMPWCPPYNEGHCGPLMFPHFQPSAMHHPPPAAPADCRQSPSKSLLPQEASQEEKKH